ncbi:MAG TPA: ferritin-like domain-containing protein, partial [Acidimicrobiales bacterium]
LLTVAFDIENAAAATYLAGIGKLENLNAAALAASVLPIESRHAVVLGQAIGLAPKDFLPALQSTADALDPADYPIQES